MLHVFSTDSALYICMKASTKGVEARCIMGDPHTVHITTSHELPRRESLETLALDILHLPKDNHSLLASWYDSWLREYGSPICEYVVKTKRLLQSWDTRRRTTLDDLVVLSIPLYKGRDVSSSSYVEEKW
jgi:hypothetical protein